MVTLRCQVKDRRPGGGIKRGRSPRAAVTVFPSLKSFLGKMHLFFTAPKDIEHQRSRCQWDVRKESPQVCPKTEEIVKW